MKECFVKNCLSVNGKGAFSVFLSRNFTILARYCSGYPVQILVAFIVISILLLLGLLNTKIEFDQEMLWASSNSDISKAKQNFESVFGPPYGFIQIIATVKNEKVDQIGLDTVHPKILEEILILEQEISKISFDGMSINTECLFPIPGICFKTSPWYYWNYNLEAMLSTQDLHAIFSWKSVIHPLGFRIMPPAVLGGTKYSREISTKIESAEAMLIFFVLNATSTSLVHQEEWEKKFTEFVLNFNTKTNYTRFSIGTNVSVKQEVERGLKGQWWLMPLSIMMMIVFVCFASGRCSVIESRIGLSLFATASLFIVSLVSFAVCSIFGVIIAPITLQLLPTLLLSVGIDNMFIMTNTFIMFQQKNKHASDEFVLTQMLCQIGPSITLSSFSLCFVFVVCTIIDAPIIRTLCIQTSVALILNYFYQIILLSSIIVLDSRRVKAKRVDVFNCILPPMPVYIQNEGVDEGDDEESTKKNQTNFTTDIYVWVLKILIGPKVRYFVLVIFLLAGVFAIIVASQVTPGLSVSSFVGSDSYVLNFLDDQSLYFHNEGVIFFIVLPNLNYTNWDVQDNMYKLSDELEHQPEINSLRFWYKNFISWIVFLGNHASEYRENGNHIPPDKFYIWLNEFLAGMGKPLTLDIQFDENGKIKVSRMMGNLIYLDSTTDYVNTYLFLKKFLSESQIPNSYPYSFFFTFLAQFINIGQMSILILGFISVGIFFVCTLFLHNLILALIIMAVILLVIAEMLSMQVGLQLGFNAVSILLMASGIGLGIEYLVHVMYIFTLVPGNTREEKVIRTATEIGSPILFSCFSSVFGLSILLFVNFPMVRYYFGIMWIGIVLIAALHGLLFLPVVLVIIPIIPDSDTTVVILGEQQVDTPNDDDTSLSLGVGLEENETLQ